MEESTLLMSASIRECSLQLFATEAARFSAQAALWSAKSQAQAVCAFEALMWGVGIDLNRRRPISKSSAS